MKKFDEAINSSGYDRMGNRIAVLLGIIAMIILAAALMTACDDGPVGYWKIESVTAGDVVMTTEDAESVGLNSVGSVKLQKSGACEVTLLGEESEGTWQQAEDGTITVSYGEEGVLTGSIDDEGVMHLIDAQGSQYELQK